MKNNEDEGFVLPVCTLAIPSILFSNAMGVKNGMAVQSTTLWISSNDSKHVRSQHDKHVTVLKRDKDKEESVLTKSGYIRSRLQIYAWVWVNYIIDYWCQTISPQKIV